MTKISGISIHCEPELADEIRISDILGFASGVFSVNVRCTQKTILNSMDPDVIAARISDLKKPPQAGGFWRMQGHSLQYSVQEPLHTAQDKPTTYHAKTAGQSAMQIGPLQSAAHPRMPPAYDGFRLCQIAEGRTAGCRQQHDEDHAHLLDIILTGRLACTFDFNDNRYHARTFVGSNPFVISIPGIVEGPARHREYYIERIISHATGYGYTDGLGLDAKNQEKKDPKHDYITRGDPRMSQVVQGILLQSVAYYETGHAFCTDSTCRMYNAHWQSDLVRTQITDPRLCDMHKNVTRSRSPA